MSGFVLHDYGTYPDSCALGIGYTAGGGVHVSPPLCLWMSVKHHALNNFTKLLAYVTYHEFTTQ